MLATDQQAASSSVLLQHPGTLLPGDTYLRRTLPGRCRCAPQATELLRPPALVAGWERRASGPSSGPVLGTGRSGQSPMLGEAGGPPDRAADVPPRRWRKLRCPLVHLEGPGLYFCLQRRKEPRAAVRLSLTRQVQARVTEGKGGERGKKTPNPPCPALFPGTCCPPFSGARRYSGAVGSAAAGKRSSAPDGHPAGCRMAESAGRHRWLLSGEERRPLAGVAGGAAGRLLSLGLPLRPCAKGAVRGKQQLAKRRLAQTTAAGSRREVRGRGALRRALLLAIDCRARFVVGDILFGFFFFPLNLLFSPFASLLLLFSCSQTSSIKAGSCVRVCVAEGVMSLLIIIFLTINASLGTLPPLSTPCRSESARLRRPLPKTGVVTTC